MNKSSNYHPSCDLLLCKHVLWLSLNCYMVSMYSKGMSKNENVFSGQTQRFLWPFGSGLY